MSLEELSRGKLVEPENDNIPTINFADREELASLSSNLSENIAIHSSSIVEQLEEDRSLPDKVNLSPESISDRTDEATIYKVGDNVLSIYIDSSEMRGSYTVDLNSNEIVKGQRSSVNRW